MIRLIIAFLGLVLIWLLWRKDLNKQLKIAAISALILLFIAGTWWEIGRDKPRTNIVALESVSVCGVSVTPSYRTNYEVELCVQNSSQHNLTRIGYTIMAESCKSETTSNCVQVEQISREIPVKINSKSRETIRENIRFEEVEEGDASIKYSATIDSLLAK